jgi:hypothetical protein
MVPPSWALVLAPVEPELVLLLLLLSLPQAAAPAAKIPAQATARSCRCLTVVLSMSFGRPEARNAWATACYRRVADL